MNVDDQLLIDYLEGQLDDDQASELKRILSEDLSLREQYEALKLSQEAIAYGHDQELKEHFGKWRDDMQVTSVENAKVRQLNIPRKWLALAASILFLGVITTIFYQSTQRPAELFASYYSEPIPNITRNGNINKLEAEYAKALRLYASENYAEAISEFQKIDKSSNRYDESLLLIVDCLVKQADWSAAQERIDEALQSQDIADITKEKLEWTDILLHLRKGEDSIAREKLDELLSSQQHLFHQRAKSLLPKLK